MSLTVQRAPAIAAWHDTIDATLAGSLYAVESQLRLDCARVLVDAGCAVHVDVIVAADGTHIGVLPTELTRVLATVNPASVDVHIMLSPGAIAEPAVRAEVERILDDLAGTGVHHVTVGRELLACAHDALTAVRASGAHVWVELQPDDDGHDIPDVDGVLVMFIPSGTAGHADPACLDKIPALAERWPVGVDGGITAGLARAAADAGATHIVSGRALLRQEKSHPQGKEVAMSDVLPDTMRTSVLTGQRALAIEDRRVPSPAKGEVLVKVAAVGVCGSDVHYFRHGRIGDFVVDGPLVLGHELSGSIVAVGDEVDPARVGQRVAIEPQKPCHVCDQCLAGRYNLCPHMEFYATPPIDGAFTGYVTIESIFAHAVPDNVSDEAAALLEPLSVAITTMRKAHIVPGSRVLIAGAGPIGIICAQTARAFGAAEVIVSDPVSERRERALAYGATRTIDPAAEDVANIGLDVDAFIDASGAPRAVFSGIQAVRPAGYAVLVGLGNPEMNLPIEHIQNKEVWVTGIFRYTDTWPTGIHLVSSGQVDLDSLVTGRFDLDQVEAALESDLDPASLKSIVYPNK
ncbi:putative chlorophyll synthesis pathway protein BchC [Leifsonia aquatica ATCC 14665]|uniref:2-desacetyl-2-hydroxyethyl bacteriochlorophyllide A dehydrogenase n=3 Tax=Leifsonia aquatica TaxID=144185 RepID=A0A7W4UX99_LEIAQ|nr:putative chlorophyll synthesis pathway protein BchC [Leifsonia aquatica ATCC 14665]MBB2967990.1 2-desacetyl-2-hydroxyethyl bacteriochlorophyllide A dehydrogenase [Leifsonia aquatica]